MPCSLSHLIPQRAITRIRAEVSRDQRREFRQLYELLDFSNGEITSKHDRTLAAPLPAVLSILESLSEPQRTISCDIQVRIAAQEHGISSSKICSKVALPSLFPQKTFVLALLHGHLGFFWGENKDYQINSLIAATRLFLSCNAEGRKGFKGRLCMLAYIYRILFTATGFKKEKIC